MAIRKNLNPRQMDLQPEMRDILMRNGMQAHIIANGDGYQLAVQGHDSPLLTYNLTEKQMLALTDWGPTLPTRRRTMSLPASSAKTSICRETLSMQEMPMEEWLWDCMDIGLVLENTDG